MSRKFFPEIRKFLPVKLRFQDLEKFLIFVIFQDLENFLTPREFL